MSNLNGPASHNSEDDGINAAKNALFVTNSRTPDSPVVAGYSFEKGPDYEGLLASYKHCGFQATNFGLAVDEINRMLDCRCEPLPADKKNENDKEDDEFIHVRSSCTVFLGYTSNIVSSGLRDTIRFLVKNRLVDCIVTTAGGVEEDLIKCLAPTYIGSFHLEGRKLRDEGINRLGNLMVPNNNYCAFEQWIQPLLDEMLEEQKTKGVLWTPSKMITWLGSKIDNEESIYYWASKNKIPVYCPALTDGSIGDMLFFHSFRSPGLILDIISDVRRIDRMAIRAVNSGMIIIGGGLIKHHICNANLMLCITSNLKAVYKQMMRKGHSGLHFRRRSARLSDSHSVHSRIWILQRNGADFAVYLNTASEFDGSDSGARPDEAISWGKIRKTANPVKIYAEASLVLPLLVMETFAKFFFKKT